MPRPRRSLLALVSLLAMLLPACAAAGSGAGPEEAAVGSSGATQPPAESSAPGAGRRGVVLGSGTWILVGGTVDGQQLPTTEEAQVTLDVGTDGVSGTSACNQYSAPLEVTADGLLVGDIVLTRMACADPIMALERAYVDGLVRVTAASLQQDTLNLTGDGVDLAYRRP